MAFKQIGTHDYIDQNISALNINVGDIQNDLSQVEYTVNNLTSTVFTIQQDMYDVTNNIQNIQNTVDDIVSVDINHINITMNHMITELSDNIQNIITISSDIEDISSDIISLSSSTTDPFQEFTSEITSPTNTYVITRSDGVYPYISILSANNAIISIDSSSYPLSGTNSVKVCLSVDTSEITFGQDDVEYIEPFEIKPNTMTTIYFERSGGNNNWTAVTWP